MCNNLVQSENEVIKNRIFGMPTTKMTRHQRVSFTAMIKIAYDQLTNNPEMTSFEYPVNDFFEMIGISKKRKQGHLFSKVFIDDEGWEQEDDEYSLEKSLSEIIGTSINMRHKDPDGKTYRVEKTVLISHFSLTREKVIFRFDEWVRKNIPAVNNVYIMKLPIIASLKSGYTVTLFEQLEQRRDFRKWEISTGNLRLIYGLEENKYKKFSDFRKHIIELSLNEINEKTNYSLAVKYKKKGRTIDKIIFTWHLEKDANSYEQWRSFVRETFTEVPLLKSRVGGSKEQHLIKLNDKGLLYNEYNPGYVYSSTEAEVLWKYMFDNQELLLIRNHTKNDTVDNKLVNQKDYSTFIGKDYFFDNELYTNIILITPTKNKLKVKFYDGNTFIITESELKEGIQF